MLFTEYFLKIAGIKSQILFWTYYYYGSLNETNSIELTDYSPESSLNYVSDTKTEFSKTWYLYFQLYISDTETKFSTKNNFPQF